MRKLFISITLLLFFTPSYAVNTVTAKIPKGCELISSNYSVGVFRKTPYQMLEVLCEMPNGKYVSYIGYGTGKRTAGIDRIIFKEHDKDSLEF